LVKFMGSCYKIKTELFGMKCLMNIRSCGKTHLTLNEEIDYAKISGR